MTFCSPTASADHGRADLSRVARSASCGTGMSGTGRSGRSYIDAYGRVVATASRSERMVQALETAVAMVVADRLARR